MKKNESDLRKNSIDGIIEFGLELIEHFINRSVEFFRSVGCYPLVFFLIGLVFTIMGLILYQKTANFYYILYFGESQKIKMLINIISLFLAFGSLSLSVRFYLKEKKANLLIGRVKSIIKSPYKKICINLQLVTGNQPEKRSRFTTIMLTFLISCFPHPSYGHESVS